MERIIKYLQLIHDLGHTVEKYGGKAFREAISDRNYDVLNFIKMMLI